MSLFGAIFFSVNAGQGTVRISNFTDTLIQNSFLVLSIQNNGSVHVHDTFSFCNVVHKLCSKESREMIQSIIRTNNELTSVIAILCNKGLKFTKCDLLVLCIKGVMSKNLMNIVFICYMIVFRCLRHLIIYLRYYFEAFYSYIGNEITI